MIKLGVNVDHVATLREARKTFEPDPIFAAVLCELAGAQAITVHLREDRRHIQKRDVELLRRIIRIKLNLEMSTSAEIVRIARNIKPDQATLVPEKRQEITTEGGLDVVANYSKIKKTVSILKRKKILTSLFIDPQLKQIDASKKAGADAIEIHTGQYANALGQRRQKLEVEKISKAATYAHRKGLIVNAGHGLNYENVIDILKIDFIEELNIGHSIISRAIFVGISQAIREMKQIMEIR